MSRTLGEMSAEERQQHAIWTEILNRRTSSDQERNRARQQLDALEFKGHSGPLMDKMTDFEKKLKAIEEQGQSMTAEDRKAIIELRKLATTIDVKKIDALATVNKQTAAALELLQETEKQHHSDNQSGWSKLDARLTELKQRLVGVNERVSDLEKAHNEKFREIEGLIGACRRDVSAVIEEALNDARSSIIADAEQAARNIVGEMLGTTEAPTPSTNDEDDVTF